jgi:YebC/PmpR family DNA-binding regulatory protein
MSGHSKWSNIKHRKAAQDAKKSNIFTKLAKDIAIAARSGSDPEMNFSLKLAIEKAKSFNVPKDNIERAIKKGSGELKDATQIEEVIYEAYGPGQIAILIKTVTDNKNRTLNEIKNIAQKNGGKIVEEGSVNWQFKQVGRLVIEEKEVTGEELEMKIIESGATDYEKEGLDYCIFTQPQNLQKVKEALEQNDLEVKEAELIHVAKNKVTVDGNIVELYEKLHDALDESDDVMAIWNNLE